MLPVENEEQEELIHAQQSQRMVMLPQRKLYAWCTLSSMLLAALCGTALVVGKHGLEGQFGALLGAYSKEGQVLPWRTLAAQLKGTAEAHGVDMDSNEAKESSLNSMMSAFDKTKPMVESAKNKIQELLGNAIAKSKSSIEALGMTVPAARTARLDAAGAMKRLEQRRLKKDRRLGDGIVAGATPIGEVGGKATDQISMGQCVLQSNSAIITIANAGFDISGIAETCDKNSVDYDEDNCGAVSADLIGQISGLASTIATLPSFCNISENVRAVCASDMASFASSISAIIALGFNIKLDCESPQNRINVPQSKALNQTVYKSGVYRIHGGRRSRVAETIAETIKNKLGGRRLPALPADPAVAALRAFENERDSKEDSQAIAECYFTAYDLANNLPSLAMDLWTTSLDCSDADTEDDKAVCVSDIITVVTDVAAIMTSAAAIASTCPINPPDHAACVADSSDVVNNALNFGAWGAVVKQDCRAPGAPGPDHFRVPLRR